MHSFKELFQIILKGDKEASRKAARGIRKFLYSSKSSKDDFNGVNRIIYTAYQVYRDIKEEWRQENFVIAVSVMYFLHDRENEPDFLFPWLFYLIQHNNGNIRQSAVRMFNNELGPLTAHIRCPGESFTSNKIKNEKCDQILFKMYHELVFLTHKFHKPIYNRYKYIASIPAGQYKSIQLVLSDLEDDCGEKYINKLNAY
jgi:hypothetical protein